MFVNTLPTFGFQPGVRCAEAQRFEERHPGIRFFTEPDGGAGGSGGAGEGGTGGSGDTGGTGDPAGGNGENEQLGEGGKKALEAERDANKELRAKIKEFEDGKLTADQKLQRDAEDSKAAVGKLESENATLKLDNARLLVAITEKVPAEWAERIKGATPEEMTADAKKIKASLRDSGDGDLTPGAGERGSDVQPTTTPGFGTLSAAYAASSKK